ncbi:hypothetical protein DL764_009246 [Monosporascus ibericus]|uniref:Protein kinase domain-containing protein n=1 Tax=Monosporascus ibericus TaxID=155417 RepID=A0A4Q4SXL5_9PEZI|nr:hypothetical protein DL764_009246 [Monosporascus ibericus]
MDPTIPYASAKKSSVDAKRNSVDRREEAEKAAKSSQPQALQQYLEACHSLSRTIQVVTDRSLTTQGDTTNPTGRIFPRRITPWHDFPAEQEAVWDLLSAGQSFPSGPIFPSPNQLEYVMSLIRPISEVGLRDSERGAVAIEYKAPHKLSRDEILTGLQSEIQPERDVIHKSGKGFEFSSRPLAAAVITQLFSYMVGKGVQYGYVFAFILQAVRSEPPPDSWHDAAAELGTWAVEYDDKGFTRSPIRTRSRCKQHSPRRHSDDDDQDPAPPSPSPGQPRRPTKNKAASRDVQEGKDRGGQQGRIKGPAGKQKIQDRPFCTQQCLYGLAYGGPMDKACPNFVHHKRSHIDPSEFLRLIRHQLATDRDRGADCARLYLAGSMGALFKVRLSSHGYTFVAKGMKSSDLSRLQQEHEVYSRIRSMQGTGVPVFIGVTDLVLPYRYDGRAFTHFIFLSYGGNSLLRHTGQIKKPSTLDKIATNYKWLHRLGVLHRDAEPRNILYDEQSGRIMLVDFERAEIRNRQPLGPISPNGLRRRKRGAKGGEDTDPYEHELQHVLEKVSASINAS